VKEVAVSRSACCCCCCCCCAPVLSLRASRLPIMLLSTAALTSKAVC
jgi:hypothetical protein